MGTEDPIALLVHRLSVGRQTEHLILCATICITHSLGVHWKNAPEDYEDVAMFRDRIYRAPLEGVALATIPIALFAFLDQFCWISQPLANMQDSRYALIAPMDRSAPLRPI